MSDRTVADEDPSDEAGIAVGTLQSVFDDNPVRVAVLFGSRVTGLVDKRSDVDIAVEFADSVGTAGEAYGALLADISLALDRNDIDFSVVSDLDPRVGYDASEHGHLVVGSRERVRTLRDRFDARRPDPPSREHFREGFDDALATVDSALNGEA